MTATVNCPTCGRRVRWEPASKWRPFCSERCRVIDLGDWLDESHRISEPFGDESTPWSGAWPDEQATDQAPDAPHEPSRDSIDATDDGAGGERRRH